MHSPFSDLGPGHSSDKPRTRTSILSELYANLTPFGAACMTQIILKDIRPVLYPIPSTRTTVSLLRFRSNAIHELTLHESMAIWDSRMPKIYKVRASLDAAAEAVEGLSRGQIVMDPFKPVMGTPVAIPKCLKGQCCRSVIDTLRGSRGSEHAWAETKYDGERLVSRTTVCSCTAWFDPQVLVYRLQVHVDLSRPAKSQIQIFSKSKRDSTMDRVACHP